MQCHFGFVNFQIIKKRQFNSRLSSFPLGIANSPASSTGGLPKCVQWEVSNYTELQCANFHSATANAFILCRSLAVEN